MPTITVSDRNKTRIEKLRHDMPLVNGKVSSVKKTVELILQYTVQNETDFIQWIEKTKGQG